MLNKPLFWASFVLSFLLAFYYLSHTLVPFIIALIVAYILEPMIEKNAVRFKLSRNIITFFIFSLFLGIFILFLILLIPLIYKQVTTFITKIPVYKKHFIQSIHSIIDHIDGLDPDITNKLIESIHDFVNSTFSIIITIVNNLWEYTLATMNLLAIIVLVPILLYYFLRDWSKMVRSIESLIPINDKSKMKQIFHDINQLLSAYIRGQLYICFLLSNFYIIGFTLIGLDLAILLGIISGFLIILPFVGALISFIIVLISAYFTHGFSVELAYIISIFFIGHAIEGYILSPKIIGDRIGLHPLWIIFAVFVCGTLFGFIGMLFAIPIAGIVKILLLNTIEYYKSSNIYNK